MAATEEAIPKQHRACVYDNPGHISTKVVNVDTPEPGPGEVLIRMTHSGVCHSDLGIMSGTWTSLPYPVQPGQVGGHEGVGRIVKLGVGSEKTGVKIGDRVGIKWISGTCGQCTQCLEGADALCSQVKVSGYFTQGTFQEYCIGPANYVSPIPEGLDSAAAAPLLCAGVTSYAALRRSGAKSGQWVVISGAGGGVGHLACQLASRGMAMRVIGIDAGSKETFVRECGAEHFIDVTKHDDQSIAKEIREITGGLGASAVIVCTASNKAYAQAMDFLRFRGTLVCVGISEGKPEPIAGSSPATMIKLEAVITAVAVGNRKEAIECLDFAARGVIKTHFKTEKMENLSKVFQDMHDAKLNGRVVLELE